MSHRFGFKLTYSVTSLFLNLFSYKAHTVIDETNEQSVTQVCLMLKGSTDESIRVGSVARSLGRTHSAN